MLLLCLVPLLTAAARTAERWEGRCVGVQSGDVITVVRDGITCDIRLYGVDCPLQGQDFFFKAAQNTHSLVHEKIVVVEPVTSDARGLTVALVSVDGLPLTNLIIESGFGTASREYCRGQDLCLDWRRLEAEAIRDGRGIWSAGTGAGFTGRASERLGRIEEKAEKIRGNVQKTRDSIAGIKAEKPPPPAAPTSGFIATPKTKKVHRVTCRNAKVPGTAHFESVNAALDAGYSLCKLCEPVP